MDPAGGGHIGARELSGAVAAPPPVAGFRMPSVEPLAAARSGTSHVAEGAHAWANLLGTFVGLYPGADPPD